MYLRYAFLADTVTIDANGKLNAIGIFERIFAASFPSIHRDMHVVINIEGTTSEKGIHKLSVELRDDKANRLAVFPKDLELKSPVATQGILRGGVIMKLQDLPFQRAGQYEFVVFADERFLGRVLFTVHLIQIQKAGEA